MYLYILYICPFKNKYKYKNKIPLKTFPFPLI